MMLGIERRQKIMEYLTSDRKVYVADLSKLLKVTEETVRRDLEKLETQDLLRRSYGGAVLNEHTSEDLSFLKRNSINNTDKQAIAKKAEFLVNDNDTLMVDSSTTCLTLLHQLKSKKELDLVLEDINEFKKIYGALEPKQMTLF